MKVLRKDTGEELFRGPVKLAKEFFGKGTMVIAGVVEEDEDGNVIGQVEPDETVELELVYEGTPAEDMEYLKDTDWYVTREAETGKPIPVDVKARRSAIRVRN